MFRYTNFLDTPAESTKPGRRVTTIPKPSQAIERPTSGSFQGAKLKTPGKPLKDMTVSERYTNRAYNRLPSPKERFQTLANGVKDDRPLHKPSTVEGQRNMALEKREREKAKSPSSRPRSFTQTLPVNQSRSDIINKKRTLEMQCDKFDVPCRVEPKRVRPKTSGCARTESHLENKVLNAVKNILSQAVMQQGKIDETNIENIMDNMKNSLNLDQNQDDDEISDIDIELKPSRTTVNEISLLEDHSEDKKIKKMAGIVRKNNLSTKPQQKPYRKIYDQMDSSPLMNHNVTEDNGETLVYVDLPTTEYINFSPSTKRDGKSIVKPKIENNVSKQNMQTSFSKKDEFSKQFEVGDTKMKADNHFWNSSEDAKLHAYVETLIKGMKCQMNNENYVTETEGEIDSQGTICRSFCVCKVCVSKNSRSKDVLKQKPSKEVLKQKPSKEMFKQKSSKEVFKQKPSKEVLKQRPSVMECPSVVVLENPKSPKPVVRRPIRSGQNKPQIQQGAINQLRLMKASSNDVKTVIKNTNPNFKPEASSLNTSLDLPSINKGLSFTKVDSPENSEVKDNMYLQRRIRRSSKTRSNVKTK